MTSKRARPSLNLDAVNKGSLGPVARALFVAALLAGAKAVVMSLDREILPASPLVSAVLGGVIFTLAILLGGVLQDFKEAERNVGEIAGQLRRLHWDLGYIGLTSVALASARAHLRDYAHLLRDQLRTGQRLAMREVMAPLRRLDDLMVQEIKVPGSAIRTVQIALGTFQRVTERLETIIETTFMRAGYIFAASAIALVLGALLLTPIAGTVAGPVLFGMVGFVLCGLFLIVYDMDNPFEGAVRVSITPIEKAADDLARLNPGT